MGWPTAYRSQFARSFQRAPTVIIIIPPVPRDIPNIPPSAWRRIIMNEITEIPKAMPPLGWGEMRRLGRYLRPLTRFSPLGRFLDLWDLFNWWVQQVADPGDLKGWSQDCSAPPPCNDTACNTSFCITHGEYWGTGAACGPGHAWDPSGGSLIFTPGARFRAHYVRRNPALEPCGGGAGFVDESWSHPFDGAQHPVYEPPIFPSNVRIPMWFPMENPFVRHPWINPDLLPIQKPAPEPLPPPYRVIPDRVMHPESERSYDTPMDRLPSYRPLEKPQARELNNPNRDSRVPVYGRRPPEKKQKEKKYKYSTFIQAVETAVKVLARVDGKLKDLRDLLKAFDDALPKQYQLKSKDKKLISKLIANLYRHLDKVDGGEAFKNVLKEIAEDLIGGAGDRLRQEAAKRMGWFKNKIFTSPRF